MSSNGINVCEDAEMADCDGEKVVTMMDVLKEQEDFEEDANAVLGASDDKNCTYSKGYVKRQAIYACLTCCMDAKNDPTKWAGVCLACSLTCHENHELIELYTKRNFRCDCGNPKFNSHPCQFTPNKAELNVENSYNQNFSGVYCICHRPYPDPESSIEEDMIQCIICEDWLHSHHLDAVVPSNDQYSEMICKACMDKNEFLHDYSNLAVNKEDMDVDILNSSSGANLITNSNVNSNKEVAESETVAISTCTSSDIIQEQSENNDLGNEIDKDETNIIEHSDAVSESTQEQESKMDDKSSIEMLENNVTPDEITQTNLTLDKANTCKLGDDIETKTEQTDNTQTEGTKLSVSTTQETNENAVENQSSLIEIEATPLDKTNMSDNRSEEQLKEDMLLADPVDADKEQKQDDDNMVTNNEIQSSTEELMEEKGSEAMKVSESVNEEEVQKNKNKDDLEIGFQSDRVNITKEAKSVVTTEKSECADTTEDSKDTVIAEETENVSASGDPDNVTIVEESQDIVSTQQSDQKTPLEQTKIEESEIEQSKNDSNTKHSDGINTVEESKFANTSEKQESILTTKISETVLSDGSENVSIVGQLDNVFTTKQMNKEDNDINNEKDVSVNENTTTIEENNCFEKDSSNDMVLDENNAEDATHKDRPEDDTEINDNCDNELSHKTVVTEILKRKVSSDFEVEKTEVKRLKLEDDRCVRPKGIKKVHHGATFWPSNFRHKLCTCNECMSMYKDLSVLFLIDPDDTVIAYETLGKEKTDGKPVSQYEKGMAALSSLGRVEQINALTEYSKLRDKLLDFLKTFKDKKLIVKEEDIKAFFAGMKPTREPDGVYFCR